MSFLKDIQNQSIATRKLMFGLALVATLAFVGRVWFESFQDNLYAALNPEEVKETQNLAESEDKGLFSVIGDSLSGLKALMNDAFDDKSNVINVENKNEGYAPSLIQETYSPLPLSPER